MSLNKATPSDWANTIGALEHAHNQPSTASKLKGKHNQRPNTSKALKDDGGKPDVGLICPEYILGTAEILTFGKTKYGKKNYMLSKGDVDYCDRLYSAIQRHLLAYASGELLDKESGKAHLFHVSATLAILVELGAHNGQKPTE